MYSKLGRRACFENFGLITLMFLISFGTYSLGASPAYASDCGFGIQTAKCAPASQDAAEERAGSRTMASCTTVRGSQVCASTPQQLLKITGQSPSVPAPKTPAQAVQRQATASGASCQGYWQNGRCVLNGLVAFSGGNPVNVMNQSPARNAGSGKKQVCTLVYTYRAGRVVGSPQSVCTFQ